MNKEKEKKETKKELKKESKKETSLKKELFKKVMTLVIGVELLLCIAVSVIIVIEKNKSKQQYDGAALDVEIYVLNSLMDYSCGITREIGDMYAVEVDGTLQDLSAKAQVIGDVVQRLYTRQEASGLSNPNVTLFSGIDWNACSTEYSYIRDIADYLSVLTNDEGVSDDGSEMLDYYLVTDSGMMIKGKMDGTAAELSYSDDDLRASSWFQQIKSSKEGIWTNFSEGRNSKLNYTYPVYDENGEFKAAVCLDVGKKYISRQFQDENNVITGYVQIYDQNGQLLLNVTDNQDVPQSIEGELKEISENGGYRYKSDGGSVITISDMKVTQWKLRFEDPTDKLIDHVQMMLSKIDDDFNIINKEISNIFIQMLVVLIYVTLHSMVITTIVLKRLSESMSKPIIDLTNKVEMIGNGDLDQTIEVKRRDEIGKLGTVFNEMVIKLKEYISNIEGMTAKEQKMNTELGITRQIQLSMLPKKTVEFSNHKEMDIFASLENSDVCSCDFYDFFFIDEDRLCVVVGETNTSGIPSMILSTITRSNIKSFASIGYSPSGILMETNNILCRNSESDINVSAFLGIIYLKTGKMDYAQASQQTVYWKHAGSDFKHIEGENSLPLATMEHVPYAMHTIQFAQGDMLFLHSRGASEMVDERNNQYMDEMLIAAVDRTMKQHFHLPEVIAGVTEDQKQFRGETELQKDSTMMMFRYFG